MEKVLLIEAKGNGGLAPVKVLDFDHGGDSLRWFYKHIECSCIDIVKAHGLAALPTTMRKELDCVSLVVDDNGLFKEPVVNSIASLLYGYMEHGQPLVGNVIVCKDVETPKGTESGGFTDEEVVRVLLAIDILVTHHNEIVEKRRAEASGES